MNHNLTNRSNKLRHRVTGLALISLAAVRTFLAQTPVPDNFNPGTDGWVNILAAQADGKVLVAGRFTQLGGAARSCLGRLRPGGDVDPTFTVGADQEISTLVVQADGGTLLGGSFSVLGGQSRAYLGRLRADGTLDPAFNPGANAAVLALAVQTNGLILAGGAFSSLGGQTRLNLARLKPDGSLDPSFNPSANAAVFTLALQPDGKILVGGWFSVLGGQSRAQVARLHADGALDTGFNPGANGPVYALAVQADGKVLLGGAFTSVAGQARYYLARINANGTLDTSFNPRAGGTVNSLAVLTDGKVLVAGAFTSMAGQRRDFLARLNADGTVDSGFDPGANSEVYALTAQSDGKVLVGGFFSSVSGQPRPGLARLHRTDPATNSLRLDGATLTWLRSGTGPEVWRTVFEASTNGTDWTSLGTGQRTVGGWQLTNVSVAAGSTVRARGQATGGRNNATAFFAETAASPPGIVAEPASTIQNGGACASFTVAVAGAEPIACQWRKNGTNVNDGGSVFGATSTNLMLCNLQPGDAGDYSVVVSNEFGTATSRAAQLQVRPCWVWSPQFGWLWDTGTGWFGGSAYGWMWFDPGGQWIWSTSLQGWLAIVDPNSPTLWSVQFSWLTPSTDNSSLAQTTAIGPIHLGTYGSTTITDGWVISDRYGYIWAAGDGIWFFSDVYGWLGVTPDGGVWCVNQGRFL